MNNNENKATPISKSQSLTLKDRKHLELSGVREVVSFNEENVILQTNQGLLNIKGQELNIHNLNLDNENIKIEGLIFSLIYSDKNTGKNILKNLFK